ncbi:MAG TPA: hypothetical protein DCL38_02400 [Lachnospiraceae bacterium]|nr:hypothetical protein [Lachnospiraceae bacterium]
MSLRYDNVRNIFVSQAEESGPRDAFNSKADEIREQHENGDEQKEEAENGITVTIDAGADTGNSTAEQQIPEEAGGAAGGTPGNEDTGETMPDNEGESQEESGEGSLTGEISETEAFLSSPLFYASIAGAVLLAVIAIVLFIKIRKQRRKRAMEGMPESQTVEDEDMAETAVKVLVENADIPVTVGSIHDTGMRNMQQDSFGISEVPDAESFKKQGILAVVADGMGGLSDGERMSALVVVTMLREFEASKADPAPASTLMRLIDAANSAVNKELGDERLGKCGSTVVAVIVKERSLSWISVGDSHIYVYRDGKLLKLNKDHNYGAELDEKLKRGEISFEEAARDPKRAALTSFIGIGELELIDHNDIPAALEKNDRVLLMSDGVYGTIGEAEIIEALRLPFKKALKAMDRAVRARQKSTQDNYTCVMIEIK